MPTLKPALDTKPSRFRTPPARGLKAAPGPTAPNAAPDAAAIDRTGGDYGAGVIRGVAVVTRGEALGHGMWLDRTFLTQTLAGLNEGPNGVKARFAHPSLSGDGLGSYLGRMKAGRLDGDVVRGDLHFSPAAHDAPDGDLAGYVMDLAESDPEAFGTSIVYMPDFGAEDRFRAENEDAKGNFQSPDPDNLDNLPHARLSQLRANDVVDDPAANPSGLFHRGQEIAQEADALLSYSVGLTTAAPTAVQLDLDPDRLRGFVNRFLESHGLAIMPKTKPTREEKAAAAAEGMALFAASETPPAAAQETPPETASPAEPAETGEGADGSKPADPPGTTAEPVEAAGDNAAADAASPEVEAQPETVADEPTEPVKPAETKPAAQSAAAPTAQAEDRGAAGRRFLDAFGELGARWFAEGKTFEEAQALFLASLKADNDRLRAQIAALTGGHPGPIAFEPAPEQAADEPSATSALARAIGPGLARFAAGMKIRRAAALNAKN